MLKVNEYLSTEGCLVVDAAGAISGEDYEAFAERFEQAVREHATVDLVVNLRGRVSYGDMDAFKDDWRFALKQYRHARRMALVGEVSMVSMAARLFAPFTRAEEEFFPPEEVDAAIEWACEG